MLSTITERTILIADKEYETRNKGATVPKGLSSMNLAEMKEEAKKTELEVSASDTKRSLMLRMTEQLR